MNKKSKRAKKKSDKPKREERRFVFWFDMQEHEFSREPFQTSTLERTLGRWLRKACTKEGCTHYSCNEPSNIFFTTLLTSEKKKKCACGSLAFAMFRNPEIPEKKNKQLICKECAFRRLEKWREAMLVWFKNLNFRCPDEREKDEDKNPKEDT